MNKAKPKHFIGDAYFMSPPQHDRFWMDFESESDPLGAILFKPAPYTITTSPFQDYTRFCRSVYCIVHSPDLSSNHFAQDHHQLAYRSPAATSSTMPSSTSSTMSTEPYPEPVTGTRDIETDIELVEQALQLGKELEAEGLEDWKPDVVESVEQLCQDLNHLWKVSDFSRRKILMDLIDVRKKLADSGIDCTLLDTTIRNCYRAWFKHGL